MLSIRIITADRDHSLYKLRAECYTLKYGEKIDHDKLKYNPYLKHCLTMGLYLEDRLISSYRLDVIKSLESAQFFLQSKNEVLKNYRVIVVGCRACTLPQMQNLGYHYILRYQAIKILSEKHFPVLMSTFESSNPWKETMTSLGYEIEVEPNGWNDFLPNRSSTVLAILDLKKRSNLALIRLREVLSQRGYDLEQIQWVDVAGPEINSWMRDNELSLQSDTAFARAE